MASRRLRSSLSGLDDSILCVKDSLNTVRGSLGSRGIVPSRRDRQRSSRFTNVRLGHLLTAGAHSGYGDCLWRHDAPDVHQEDAKADADMVAISVCHHQAKSRTEMLSATFRLFSFQEHHSIHTHKPLGPIYGPDPAFTMALHIVATIRHLVFASSASSSTFHSYEYRNQEIRLCCHKGPDRVDRVQ